MSVLEIVKQYADVALLSGFLLFWALWKSRGRTIEVQKVKIQSMLDDSETAPLVKEGQNLDAKLETLDADRLKKEALLDDALNGKSASAGTSPGGSKPLP